MKQGLEIQRIRRLRKEGYGIREIAHLTDTARNTVRKYLSLETDDDSINDDRHRSELWQKREEIRKLFIECQGNCSAMASRISGILDKPVGARSLQIFCSPFRKELQLFFFKRTGRFETGSGKQLQIDFGECDVIINGVRMRIHFFVAVLGFSRCFYVKAYLVENADTWLDGIESAFHYFGGVTREIVSDNTRCLVRNPNSRNYQEKYTIPYIFLCNYYGTVPVTTAIGAPNSKGKVEILVKYVKRNFLPGREFKSLDNLNEELLKWLEHVRTLKLKDPTLTGPRTREERFAIEKPRLIPCDRPKLGRINVFERQIDRNGLLRIENTLYQIPERFAGQKVQVTVGPDHISIFKAGMEPANVEKAKSVFKPSMQNGSREVIHSQNGDRKSDATQPGEGEKAVQNYEMARDLSEYDSLIPEDGVKEGER